MAPGLSQHSVSKSWISVSLKIVHGLTRAATSAEMPGSRVSDRSSCGVPTAPSSILARMPAKSLAKRRLKPTCSATPAVRAASMARSASSSVRAIGFSQNTCLPDCAAAMTRSAWLAAGEQIATASMDRSAIRSSGSRYVRGAESRSAAPGWGSATAVKRAFGRRRAKVSAWKAPIQPAPMSPKDNGVGMRDSDRD